jgi:hypothetical protein
MATEPVDHDSPAAPADDDRTAEILAEAQRRVAEHNLPASNGPNPRTVRRLNRGVYWLAVHWVGFFNLLILLYVGGTILAPVLMHLGAERGGNALYAFYRPFCHQYPFRSFFLFGESAIQPLQEPIPLNEMTVLSRFVGDPQVGYKIAFCQRDVAIYGMMVVAGVIYGLLRRIRRDPHSGPHSGTGGGSRRIPPLPLWLYFAFGILPMLLDGGVQWLSYALWQFIPGLLDQPFETIPAMRVLTGALFGFGVVAVGYPYLAEYFDDVLLTLEKKYGW